MSVIRPTRSAIGKLLLAAALLIFAAQAHAITHVGSTVSSGNTNTVTIDAPAGLQAEDVIVAQIVIRGGSAVTFTPPSGWTLIRAQTSGAMTQRTYYRIAGASEPASYSWGLSGGNRQTVGILSAYRGVSQVDPIDVHNGQTGSGTTVTAPSVTTTVTGTRLIGTFAAEGGAGGSPFSTPTGMSVRQNEGSGGGANNGVRAMLADQQLTDAGATGNRTSDSGTSSNHAGQLIALRPPAPGQAEVAVFGNGSSGSISVDPLEPITLTATVANCTTGGDIGPYYDTWRLDADNLSVEEFSTPPCDRGTISYADNPLTIANPGVYTIRFISGYDDAIAEDTLEDGRGTLQIIVGDPSDPGDPVDDRLPDCAEAFGDSHLNVHDGEQGNLNMRDGTRVFRSTAVGANVSGPSRLQQRAGTHCIADDDPTDTSPSTCEAIGSVRSWEDAGRDFPEPPSSTYPGTENLNVGAGDTVTLDTTEGTPLNYNQINIANGGHLIINGNGEITADSRLLAQPGAELTINDRAILNIDARFEFGGPAARSFINVNGELARSVDFFARQNIILRNTTVRVSEGTWRPITMGQGGSIEVSNSDVNCDPTHQPGAGWQPANVMPDCQWEDGGVFMISRATGSVEDSSVRAFIYVDGTQYNVNRSLIKGSLTSGGNTMRESDFVPDGIPNTGGLCEERIDDIRVEAGPLASTCRRHPVTLTALDRYGQQLYTYRDTMELQTSSNHGNWWRVDDDGDPGDPEATNAPTNTGNDSGYGRQNFDPDDLGQVQIFLENIHADDLTITATDMQDGVSGLSDVVSFRDNVFVIESVDDFDDDVIAGRNHLFEATLWQRDRDPDAEPLDCAVPTSYNSDSQSVRMWHDRHGDDPGGANPVVDPLGGGGPATLPTASPGSENVTLDFSGANSAGPGRARFELETSDVGKYALLMGEENSGFAVDDAGDPRTIDGGSDHYVVRPFGFDIQVAGNPAADGPEGAVFRNAGEPFDITVRPVVYLPAADTNNDGYPDGYGGLADDDPSDRVDLSAAATTPSFGQEGIAGNATVDAVLWAPDDGMDPGLENNDGPIEAADFADTANAGAGEAERTDVYYEEVGIVVLNAAHENYLGSGRQIRGGTPSTVGRFIPAYFTLDPGGIAHRSDLDCNPVSEFTYMGEDFVLDEFVLTARPETFTTGNAARTQNYQGDFAFLDPDNEAHFGVAGFDDDDPVDDLQARSSSSVQGWEQGVLDDAEIVLRVTRNCADEDCPKDPYEALVIGLNPEDTDGVTLGTFDIPNDGSETHGEAATAENLRFGRIVLDNAAGSELVGLRLPMRVEYWDGDTWLQNVDDSCTAIVVDTTEELTLASDGGDTNDGTGTVGLDGGGDVGIDDADGAVDGGAIRFENGETAIPLTAPGDGNIGWLDVILNLDNRWSYLRDNLTGDDDEDWQDSPTGRATYGIREGAEGRIIIQEVDPG